MEIEKILKVKFLKSGDYISTTGEEIIEINVDFDQLLGIISEIELKRDGLGKSLHKEAFTGVDYLGNKVSFSSYVVWQDNGKIYKYNFDENLIPFNAELISRNREEKIQNIIK
jgi:hypothetical protein